MASTQIVDGITYETVSHDEMTERAYVQHDEEKPFAPENGEKLKYNIGDTVKYTNEYGVSFGPRTIIGFYKRSEAISLYAQGCRYYIDSGCPWMPVKESSLTPWGE